jgi:hypothetical protein
MNPLSLADILRKSAFNSAILCEKVDRCVYLYECSWCNVKEYLNKDYMSPGAFQLINHVVVQFNHDAKKDHHRVYMEQTLIDRV